MPADPHHVIVHDADRLEELAGGHALRWSAPAGPSRRGPTFSGTEEEQAETRPDTAARANGKSRIGTPGRWVTPAGVRRAPMVRRNPPPPGDESRGRTPGKAPWRTVGTANGIRSIKTTPPTVISVQGGVGQVRDHDGDRRRAAKQQLRRDDVEHVRADPVALLPALESQAAGRAARGQPEPRQKHGPPAAGGAPEPECPPKHPPVFHVASSRTTMMGASSGSQTPGKARTSAVRIARGGPAATRCRPSWPNCR